MNNTFVLSWDQTGLESVFNVTEHEQAVVFDLLRDHQPQGRNNILNAIIIRARANSQRHYEVYAIDVDDTITEDDLRSLFENAPQHAAELIRSRGRVLHSDRVNAEKVKIT